MERDIDIQALKKFTAAMMARLDEKRAEGRQGWYDVRVVSDVALIKQFNDAADAGQWINAANLAMMLWNRENADVSNDVRMIPVVSSQIKSIGYNAELAILTIEFTPRGMENKGAMYEYQNVDPDLYHKLMTAESIGSFFGKVIKPNKELYPFKKLVT